MTAERRARIAAAVAVSLVALGLVRLSLIDESATDPIGTDTRARPLQGLIERSAQGSPAPLVLSNKGNQAASIPVKAFSLTGTSRPASVPLKHFPDPQEIIGEGIETPILSVGDPLDPDAYEPPGLEPVVIGAPLDVDYYEPQATEPVAIGEPLDVENYEPPEMEPVTIGEPLRVDFYEPPVIEPVAIGKELDADEP